MIQDHPPATTPIRWRHPPRGTGRLCFGLVAMAGALLLFHSTHITKDAAARAAAEQPLSGEAVDDPGNQKKGEDEVPNRQSPDDLHRPPENGETTGYGRTPESAQPFRNFREPYVRFFEEITEFRGAGREKDAASAGSTVRIGILAPSGSAPDADLGRFMLQGATLAFEEANAAGGYRGTPFELVLRQDVGAWGASSNEMVAFRYHDEVLAVLGSVDGANSHIALRVALKTQMPMVNTATTDPTLTETRIPWLLRCMADDRQQGYALAHHIFRRCGIQHVVALRVNDRFGRTGIAEFADAARRLGSPLRAELRWNPGEKDFTVQLDRIAMVGADAVVLWGNAVDTAEVVKAIRRRGMDVRLFGCDRLASAAFLSAAGEAAEGVTVAASFDPTRNDPRLHSFVAAYAARFGEPPETFAAHAYDGACILIAAVHAGSLNRVRIRDALSDTKSYDGVTGPILFDTTLNDVGPVYLATIRNGRFDYREADFAVPLPINPESPYRAMMESPPSARSPERPAPADLRIGCFLPLDDEGRCVVSGMRQAIADDAERHPSHAPVELVVCDARGPWGDNARALVDLVCSQKVLTVLGSTERRGTHLAEMLAAKMHFPVVSLCGADPTVTRIPLPWVFSVVPDERNDGDRSAPNGASGGVSRSFALGYDAAALVVDRIREGARNRRTLRDRLASGRAYSGLSGVFQFGPLGDRVECAAAEQAEGGRAPQPVRR